MLTAGLAMGFLAGCSDDDGIDNRDRDYGYVQFRLYKEASYDSSRTDEPQADAFRTAGTRAVKPQLDYLAEASKVQVTLTCGEQTIIQTLTLSAADKQSAEYGMRSDKLKLLTGEYEIARFTLFDSNDEELYNGNAADTRLTVVSGGLTTHDLTVNVLPRGSVRFTLTKDMSGFNPPARTRSDIPRQYIFEEIGKFDVTVKNTETNNLVTFEQLPVTFSIHFDDEENAETPPGYQTSTCACDSLLSLPAGNYVVLRYLTYDSDGILLETNNSPVESPFTVEDNRTTEADVAVTLYEADEYMKDHYALYAIWKALHGEEWSYQGENYPIGSNWDFNKDPDLWSYQPGVEVHTNGRVAKIDLSGFGFYGDMPKEIGQLTELVELYLGTHNDVTQGFEDPTLDPNQSIAERTRNRLENHKKYLHLLHPAQQMSWPCAFALREHNIHIRATELYDQGYTEDEIFEAATGRQRDIRPLDTSHGKLCNGLKSLPAEIGNLKKLEYLYIANSAIESLPDYEGEGKEGMQGLESCTDFEVYNCPKMEKFPIAITKMPRLVAANLSNNKQWQAQDLHDGLKALAEGPSKEYIQLLYLVNNSLEELPAEFRNMKRLSMLDLTQNRLRVLHPLGSEVALVQLFLDNNRLEEIPTDENGIFCNIADMTDLSASYNKLRKFPNIFKEAKSAIANIDLSYNQIANFTEEETAAFHGVFVETLTLTGNTGITKFPKWLADSESQVAYIILRGCGITEIPEGSFKGKYSNQFVSLDLTYNRLSKLPDEFNALQLPNLYGLDISQNAFSKFPTGPLTCKGLTILGIRGQRDADGERCLREWPTGLYNHVGLRGFYIGSNDLRKIDDTISTAIWTLDISDNPNITFDASGVCSAWQSGAYVLIYDKTQNIVNCDAMLE